MEDKYNPAIPQIPNDAVLTCIECGMHEFVLDGVDYRGMFYCKKCAGKEITSDPTDPWQGRG